MIALKSVQEIPRSELSFLSRSVGGQRSFYLGKRPLWKQIEQFNKAIILMSWENCIDEFLMLYIMR